MGEDVECVVRGDEQLGECTVWDDREQALWWVDIRGPALKRYDPASGAVRVVGLPEAIGSFGLRRGEGMVAGMKSGLYLLDPKSGALQPIVSPDGDPQNRFNDGRCDRAGRFWAGTMRDGPRARVGSLFRLDAARNCTKMKGDIAIPNSLAWSPDDRVMYFADTHRPILWAYDFDLASGEMRNERVFPAEGVQFGRPDGACVDSEGCLWSADYGGWRVVRYTPAGRIDRTIPLPIGNPTCCCFGGKDLDTLYISTARQRLTPEEIAKQPLAGSVFAVRPGVRGLAEARYAG